MRRSMMAAAMVAGLAAALPGCQSDTSSGSSGSGRQTVREDEQGQLVEKAKLAVETLRSDKLVGRGVNDALDKARGVVVFPNLLKAGFFFGGGGGQGVLLARQGAGWSDPAFVYAADASFGLQIGVEGGPVILAVMNDGALQKLINGNVNLGADLNVAVGPIGGGVQGATTPNVGADLLAFAAQQGAYAGAVVKGGVIEPNKGWNEAWYGPGATAQTAMRGVHNRPYVRDLKQALSYPAPRQTSSLH